MANRYDSLRALFSELSHEFLSKGKRGARSWFSTQDPRRADFTWRDVEDVKFENGILSYWLKDGRTFSGPLERVRPLEIGELSAWAEVKSVEENIGLGDFEREKPGDHWYDIRGYSDLVDVVQVTTQKFSTEDEAVRVLQRLLEEGVIRESEKQFYGVYKVTKGPGSTEYWRVQVA